MKRIALAWLALVASGCSALPTATLRDAQVLPNKAFTVEGAVGGSNLEAQGVRTSGEEDSRGFGGAHLDGAVRIGAGNGREHAFRAGVGGESGLGFYGGYERAYQLAEAKHGGIVGYFGGVAGGQNWHREFLPFVQPYAGLVLGVLDLPIRPELALRVAGQTGLYQQESGRLVWRGYGLSFASVEPRLRLSLLGFDAFLGIGVGYGYSKCPDCYFSNRAEPVTLVSQTLGVSMDFPEAFQTRDWEPNDPIRWWNIDEAFDYWF